MACAEIAFEVAKIIVGIAVAGGASWIAYNQYTVAKNKLKLDLFDRRFEVFRATQLFVASIIRNDDLVDLNAFIVATNPKTFLFDDDVTKWLSEMLDKGAKLKRVKGRMQAAHKIGKSPDDLYEAEDAIEAWFLQQKIADKFIPYLDFRKAI